MITLESAHTPDHDGNKKYEHLPSTLEIYAQQSRLPRLLHGPNFLTVPILGMHLYLDCFTVPSVSQSRPTARILIKAAESVPAFNVALVSIAIIDNTYLTMHEVKCEISSYTKKSYDLV